MRYSFCFSKVPMFQVMILALASLVLAGCGTIRPYNVQVTPDPSIRNDSVEVDMAGVKNQIDLAQWRSYSVDQYFKPDNPFRKNSRSWSIRLNAGKQETVGVNDPIWNQAWAGARYLVVMANLAGEFEAGPNDPRRIIIDLKSGTYRMTNRTLQIEVNRGRVILSNPQRKSR
jgi:hypothetical protein